MPFTQVTLTGKVLLSNAVAAPGASVTFTLNTPITDGTQVIAPKPLTARCDVTGAFSIALNANDDSTTTPTGSYYEVAITFGNQQLDVFNVIVPHADAPTVGLFTLAQLVNPNPTQPFVSSFNGRNGVVVPQSGDYTAAQVGADAAGTSAAETTRAEAAEALAVQKANNLSDVADAGTSRLNLHVAELAVCQVAATSNVTLSGLQTIDGYTTLAGDLVLCTGQSTASQNGPWLAASGAWTRPHEYAHGASIVAGRTAAVVNGTVNAASRWVLTTAGTVTVDTTATTWVPNLPSSVVSASSASIYLLKSYGAVLDGTTDDAAAVQAAINDMSSKTNGGTLLVTGPCRLGTGIVMPDHGGFYFLGASLGSDYDYEAGHSVPGFYSTGDITVPSAATGLIGGDAALATFMFYGATKNSYTYYNRLTLTFEQLMFKRTATSGKPQAIYIDQFDTADSLVIKRCTIKNLGLYFNASGITQMRLVEIAGNEITSGGWIIDYSPPWLGHIHGNSVVYVPPIGPGGAGGGTAGADYRNLSRNAQFLDSQGFWAWWIHDNIIGKDSTTAGTRKGAVISFNHISQTQQGSIHDNNFYGSVDAAIYIAPGWVDNDHATGGLTIHDNQFSSWNTDNPSSAYGAAIYIDAPSPGTANANIDIGRNVYKGGHYASGSPYYSNYGIIVNGDPLALGVTIAEQTMDGIITAPLLVNSVAVGGGAIAQGVRQKIVVDGPVDPRANEFGLLAQSYPIDVLFASATNLRATSGHLYGIKVPIPALALRVTNIVLDVNQSGGTLTSGENWAGIYSSAGTLLGQSADLTTAWGSTHEPHVIPIVGGPITIIGGPGAFVWVAVLSNGTTGVGLHGSAAATTIDVGWLTAAKYSNPRLGNLSGQTTLPGSITPGSNTTENVPFWAALS